MTGDIRKSFESLLKNGEYAEAEKQLNEFIELHPEDREAKVLFGTCRMLQGDTETAKKIHDELEPQFSQNPDLTEPEKSFWQKYHRWIIYGTAAALIVAAGIIYCGKEISSTMCRTSAVIEESVPGRGRLDTTVYAGPPFTYYCKSCGKPTKIAWGFIRDEKYYNELRAKVDKGLIPCETCGKDTTYSMGGTGTANHTDEAPGLRGDKHD